MLPDIRCPKCNSNHIVADRKKMREDTLGGQTLLTCGTGLPANLTTDSDIDVSCLNCGFAWNPKRLLERPLTSGDAKGKKAIGWIVLLILIAAIVFWLTR